MSTFTIDENKILAEIIDTAISEDLGNAGDITSAAIFDKSDFAEAVIKSKAAGVLSGAYILKPLFAKVNSSIVVDVKAADGQELQPGTIICTLKGPVTGILAGERIALNLLQRLSGIATATSKIVSEICCTSTRLLDTRKTTPGLRLLEKKAVVHGGGSNHRFGLFDMILIKDTHVKRSNGVGNALKKALDYRKNHMSNVKIEVEVQSIEEFHEALAYKADRIMLDNMNVDKMKSCVDYIRNNNINVELEASGNITAETARQIASCGVDFISSGAITHSAPALDIHLVIL